MPLSVAIIFTLGNLSCVGTVSTAMLGSATLRPAPVQIRDELSNTSAGSPSEAAALLCNVWQRVWNRELVSTHDAHEAWVRSWGNQAHYHRLEWQAPTADEMYGSAQDMQGKASGADGWTGDEVAEWPHEAWRRYADLVRVWFDRGEPPQAWKTMRQVHIPKEDLDNAVAEGDVSKLRPITVESVLWRCVASAWTRCAATRDWILQWIPREAHGAIKGRSVATAVALLHDAFLKGRCVLSLDLKKAFDFAQPEVALACLRSLGCPPELATMCGKIWGDQRRWIQYRGLPTLIASAWALRCRKGIPFPRSPCLLFCRGLRWLSEEASLKGGLPVNRLLILTIEILSQLVPSRLCACCKAGRNGLRPWGLKRT